MAKVTAYVLSEEIAADEAHIAGFPGVWSYDTPMLPDAVGMTSDELDAAIDEFNLPLVAVDAGDDALDEFPEPANHYPSGPEAVGVFAAEEQPEGESAGEAREAVSKPAAAKKAGEES